MTLYSPFLMKMAKDSMQKFILEVASNNIGGGVRSGISQT